MELFFSGLNMLPCLEELIINLTCWKKVPMRPSAAISVAGALAAPLDDPYYDVDAAFCREAAAAAERRADESPGRGLAFRRVAAALW